MDKYLNENFEILNAYNNMLERGFLILPNRTDLLFKTQQFDLIESCSLHIFCINLRSNLIFDLKFLIKIKYLFN